MTVLAPFLAQVERVPERPALVDRAGRTISYAGLSARSAALARRWRVRGVVPGDRVLVAVPVSIPLYAAVIALWRLGAVAVFPEPALGLAGLRVAARATRPRAFCAPRWLRCLTWPGAPIRAIPLALAPDEDGAPGADVLACCATEDTALVSFTSGSTGAPKAMPRSHGLLRAQLAATGRLLDPGDEPARDLVWFPVFVLAALALGVTAVLPDARLRRPDRLDAARLSRQMEAAGATRLLAPPAVCERLCALERMPALRSLFTGGGPVFPDMLARLADRLPDAAIHAVYGSTEAEPIAHLALADVAEADWKAMGSGAGLLAGLAVPEARLRLDDCEILVAGAHVVPGYLDPAQDAGAKVRDPDGTVWHRTGDAGRLDDAGRLWLLGRVGAAVAGLHPFQVEVAARGWPGVRQAALVPVAGRPVLAVAGDAVHLADWRRDAAALGVAEVRAVRAIPLDRRHRSKTDYARLAALLRA